MKGIWDNNDYSLSKLMLLIIPLSMIKLIGIVIKYVKGKSKNEI